MRRGRRTMAAVGAGTALGAALGLAGPAQAATAVARWNMGDSGSTMSDATGRGHTGTLHDVRTGQAGYSGRAFGFSGNPSYVSVPSASDLNPGSSGFSFTLHVRFSSRPSASVVDYDLLRKGLSATSGGSYKAEILQSGRAYCGYIGSSGSVSVSSGPDLADGRWHTITCSRSSTRVTLTVDGTAYSKSGSTGTISNSSPVYLGAKDGGGADQYTGLMDAVSVSKG